MLVSSLKSCFQYAARVKVERNRLDALTVNHGLISTDLVASGTTIEIQGGSVEPGRKITQTDVGNLQTISVASAKGHIHPHRHQPPARVKVKVKGGVSELHSDYPLTTRQDINLLII